MDRSLSWRPLVVSDNPLVRAELLEVLRNGIPPDACSAIERWHGASAIGEAVERQKANLCLLDMTEHEDSALALLRELSAKGLTVIALQTGDNSGLILRCLRCGASEFLSEPFDEASVWPVLDELSKRRSRPEAGARGSVCLVVPSKPNLGSTTIAINLARRAQEAGAKPVLLADLDPLYGGIAFQLKIQSEYTFLDAFKNWDRMDGELWRNLIVDCEGLDVLVSPETAQGCEFEAPPASDFTNLLRRYHVLSFLDCPGLWTPWYAQLATAADDLLLITTNEVTELHATRRSLSILHEAGVQPGKLKLLVNRYEPDRGLPAESIEAALKIPVFHTLPNEYDVVQKALLDKKPITSNSRLGKSLNVLSERLSHRPPMEKVSRSWTDLFSRRKTEKQEIRRRGAGLILDLSSHDLIAENHGHRLEGRQQL